MDIIFRNFSLVFFVNTSLYLLKRQQYIPQCQGRVL